MSYRRLSCSSFPNVLSFDGEEEIERVDDRDALSSRHRRSSLETTLKSSSVVSLPPLAPTPSKTTGGATSKALKRWKGNVLSAVKPINEASEKRKFFHDKTSSYNPQFVYRYATNTCFDFLFVFPATRDARTSTVRYLSICASSV